jgi:uncharacterized protein YndB with AHSA1/START domain
VPDIAMACNIDADPETVFRAISTSDGVKGWFTSEAEIGEGEGAQHRLTFPDMPAPWQLRVDKARGPRLLALSVLAGPPQWTNTTMTYEIVDRPEGGVVLKFDHSDFADVEGVRAWTIGWATKMLALRRYAETGEPDPFFNPEPR